MIDGRELRFGNLFYWSDPEMDEVKGHKTIGTVYKHNIGDGEFMDAIPLTKEWLLKFDFEGKQEEGSEYWTIQIGNNLNLTISLNDYTAGIDLEWKSQGSQIWMMIDAVHKLQNVFYYLAGEELKIKD